MYGIGEFLHPLIRGGIRRLRRTQQGQIDAPAVNVDTILAVVQHRHAAVGLAQRRPFLIAHFKPVGIKGTGPVIRPRNMPELYLVQRFVGVNARRKLDLEQFMLFTPVDPRPEFKTTASPAQPYILNNLGLVYLPFHTHDHGKGATRHHPQGCRLIQRDRHAGIVGINIPGFPPAGIVTVHPQGIHRAGNEFLTRRLVLQAHDLAPVIEPDTQMLILHAVSVDQRSAVNRYSFSLPDRCPTAGRKRRQDPVDAVNPLNGQRATVGIFRALPGSGNRHQGHPFPGQGIEGGNRPVAGFHQGSAGLVRYALHRLQNLAVKRFRFPVHPLNGRPRNNVMELVEQDILPCILHDRNRISYFPQSLCHGTPAFRRSQGKFTRPVTPLGPRLCRVGSPVGLVIQLTDIYRQVFVVPLPIHKEVHRMTHPGLGCPFKIALPTQVFKVCPGYPAASIPMSKRNQAAARPLFLSQHFPSLDQGGRIRRRVVIVMDMTEYPGPVNPLPQEGVIREWISPVIGPENLVRGEIFQPAALDQLGDGAGITEHVRQPHQLAVHPELFLEEPQSVHELPDQAFTTGHIGIRFHPHAAFGDELPPAYGRLDLPVQRRVFLFNDPVQVSLALQEPELGIFPHQAQLRAERPGNLPLRLLKRPQPCHIDMGMPETIEIRSR